MTVARKMTDMERDSGATARAPAAQSRGPD
jgi:hypothetical protein